MNEVLMPRLSDSMEEGTILQWLIAPGAETRRGDELVEIETDKATMTYEADADGFLDPIAQEGDTLPVGAIIARLVSDPSLVGRGDKAKDKTDGPIPDSVAPPVATLVDPDPISPPHPGTGDWGSAAPSRVKASPLARRLASVQGVDLAAVKGTGPGGRIVRADIESAQGAPAGNGDRSTRTAPPLTSAPLETAKGEVTTVDLTRTQEVVARRMSESKATVPDFTLTVEVDMTDAVALRTQLKEVTDPAPSLNDLIVRACALALREYPRANGAYRDSKFELYGRVNVGIAVAAQDSLVVPTVFDADQQSVAQIATTTRRLAERVRTNEITPPELSGGTFTVSNLGMYGITQFTAVINSPQAAILAVGAISADQVMRMTLTCDHRILYGADAAQFLARIRELLEKPLGLLL